MNDVLYVGFNRRVAAIDQRSGSVIWQWKASHGTGFVSLLLEGEKLFVSVNGYLYALDARTGAQLWHNPMKGFGYGVASLCSSRGRSGDALLGQAQARAAQSDGGSHGSGDGGD